jgi:hypothetical protein
MMIHSILSCVLQAASFQKIGYLLKTKYLRNFLHNILLSFRISRLCNRTNLPAEGKQNSRVSNSNNKLSEASEISQFRGN